MGCNNALIILLKGICWQTTCISKMPSLFSPAHYIQHTLHCLCLTRRHQEGHSLSALWWLSEEASRRPDQAWRCQPVVARRPGNSQEPAAQVCREGRSDWRVHVGERKQRGRSHRVCHERPRLCKSCDSHVIAKKPMFCSPSYM